MSHLYILATGLLTQGQTLTRIEPSIFPTDAPPVWSNANDTEFLEQLATHQIVASLELPIPEFSQKLQQIPDEFYQTASNLTSTVRELPDEEPLALSKIEPLPQSTPESFNSELEVQSPDKFIQYIRYPSVATFVRPELSPGSTEFSQINSLHPASGTQLYYQRVAALESGQIYTRVAADKFYSSWAKANQKPTYEQWKRLLEMEAKAIARGQGVNRLAILVGDSLTMWFPQEELPVGSLWLNQGISGDNSSGILKRLSAFSQTKPDVIYVLAGINDLRQGATDQVILGNLHQIVRRLRQDHPQAQVVVQSILPTRLTTIPNSRIRDLNQQIAVIAQQEGARYLDLHTRFTDTQGNLRENLTTDGLHLSPHGYAVWQSVLRSQWSVITAKLQN